MKAMKTMNPPTSAPAISHRSCSKFGACVALAALCVLLGGQYQAAAWLPLFSDNFDAGPPDTGWNHYDPIHTAYPAYPANTYTFPVDPAGGYNYQLQATASPDPATLGPARSASYRSDIYTNFNITADLMPGWAGGPGVGINGNWVQFMGLVARLQTIGPATTAGYAFGYVNAGFYGGVGGYDNFIALFRIYGDVHTQGVPGSGNGSPGNCEYHFGTAGLDNSKAYRFQFIGKGTHLEGRVYDLANTNTPIAVLDANTAGDGPGNIYTNGPCGLFGFNYSDASANPCFCGPLDMTWDNYTASYHSPYEIRDDFNRQSDGQQNYPPWSAPAWARYDPRGDVGMPATTYSFPNLGGGNYGYEINAPLTPSGWEAYGPARAGSVRTEASYSDFYVAADVSNWNPVQMVFGLVGRGNSLGLGTTSGYIWTYEGDGDNPITWPLWISKMTGEAGSGLGSPVYNQFQAGRAYRMTFTGKGTNFTGRVTDLTTGSTNIVITATDSANSYPEGYVGLLVAASQSSPDPFAINPYVTFDNFYADTAEPTLQYSTDGAGHAVLKWPATLASIWTLQSGTNVAPTATWTEVPAGDSSGIYIYYDPTTGLNGYTNSAAISASAPKYFRLKRLDPLAYP